MRFPWVSRRAYDLILEQFERVLKERNEQQERADRAMDQMASRFGFEPVTPVVRTEFVETQKKQQSELEQYLSQTNEGSDGGMIDESYVDEIEQNLVGPTPEVV